MNLFITQSSFVDLMTSSAQLQPILQFFYSGTVHLSVSYTVQNVDVLTLASLCPLRFNLLLDSVSFKQPMDNFLTVHTFAVTIHRCPIWMDICLVLADSVNVILCIRQCMIFHTWTVHFLETLEMGVC